MDICAHCGRKLLSHMSAKCNWCGREIQDAHYQEAAELERVIFRAEQALHDLQSFNMVHGTLRTDPIDPLVFEARAQARQQERGEAKLTPAGHGEDPTESPVANPDEETKDRFEHLEL